MPPAARSAAIAARSALRVEAPARERHGPDRLAAEPEQLDRARHAAVRLGRHVAEQPRAAGEPRPAHVARPRGGRRGSGQADDRRRGRPAREQAGARRVRVADQLRQPAHGRALEVHVRVVAGHDARVHRGRGQRRQHARQRRRRVDPAEERRVPVPHRVGQHVARHRRGERAELRRPVRERQREQLGAQVVGQRLPDRLRRAAPRGGRRPRRRARGRPAGTRPGRRCQARPRSNLLTRFLKAVPDRVAR